MTFIAESMLFAFLAKQCKCHRFVLIPRTSNIRFGIILKKESISILILSPSVSSPLADLDRLALLTNSSSTLLIPSLHSTSPYLPLLPYLRDLFYFLRKILCELDHVLIFFKITLELVVALYLALSLFLACSSDILKTIYMVLQV